MDTQDPHAKAACGAPGSVLGRGRGFGLAEFCGAVGAELVGVGDFSLTLRAGGMEIAFAAGAEIEPGVDAGSALRTGEGKRLSDEQIDNEANEEVPARE